MAKKPKKAKASKKSTAKDTKKKAPAKKTAAAGKRGKKAAFSDSAVITVLADSNPKREGSKAHKCFSLYKNGMTVGDFKKKGGRSGDVNWDVEKGYIKVDEPKAA